MFTILFTNALGLTWAGEAATFEAAKQAVEAVRLGLADPARQIVRADIVSPRGELVGGLYTVSRH